MAGARAAPRPTAPDRAAVLQEFFRVRADTENVCRPLGVEDYGIQTMAEVSPAKWHIAHTSWFFETFILIRFAGGYRRFNPDFDHLFNSYYVTHGQPFLRQQRGFLSRPSVSEVYRYRAAVDEAIEQLGQRADQASWAQIEPLLLLGINHEQQHQELLLTDIKHAFSVNPLRPAYRTDLADTPALPATDGGWSAFDGGLIEMGADAREFAYDNEQPRHRHWLEPFALADRPVSNAEFMSFIDDGGYRDPRWWLSDGWATVQAQGWQAPLYWERRDDEWWNFTLGGMRPIDPAAPVCHVSHFEADAFARWAGRRLPTEAEWELAASSLPGRQDGENLRDADHLQPVAPSAGSGLVQLFGDVWEWTASPYTAYPGFRAPAGPVGEYNGKFMSSQIVLRGGSCVTPDDHIRASYRNFFYPKDRWQFSGIRLAEAR